MIKSDISVCVIRCCVKVASWGLMLAASNSDMKAYWSNDIFAKLCSMARDMNMKVRVEAFSGLRKMEMVSEDLLLQSLSKRVSGHGKQKETLGQRTSEQFVMLATNVAGALVHGLEDEFFEVRKSVCESLRTLTSLSSEFARKALDSLMDVLNDESEVVRLQSLETLHHMAINGRLKLLEKHLHMVETALEGNVEFNSARIAALLILSISAALLNADVGRIPPVMFSYAVTFLGRIYNAFSDIMDRDALLACLCEKSRSTEYSATNINPGEGEQQFPLFEGDAPNFASNEVIGSKIDSHITREQKEVANDQVEQQQSVYNEVTNLINYILAKLPDMWPRIQSGHTNEVLRSLRCLKELTTMKFDSLGSGDADALAFTLLYLRIIELLAEVWNNLLPAKGLCYQGIGKLEFKLGKLDRRVKELMSRFIGFSAEEELNVLELMLLTYTLRISKEEISCINHTLKRLSSLYLRVESILKESSALPSNFLVELGKVLSSTSINGASCSPLQFEACLKFFSLKQFVFHGPIKHVKAELSVPNIDFEHPLPFVSGLPVGIQCEITLHNILSESRLWLRMTLDDGFIQYFFLDLDCSEGSEEVRKCTFVAPFYRTAEADCLILKALDADSMDMEIDLSNLGTVNTMFTALFRCAFYCMTICFQNYFALFLILFCYSKMGVPIKTTISANVLEEALNGTVTIRPLPIILAVKKLDKRVSDHQTDDEFLELINSIDRIRHPNIVELIGYCAEHGQRLLIYEYCSNGSLQDALHSDDEFKTRLSWNSRYK
ncbi:Protein STRUBBELIG-RECEPTOR FAMILY 3 [Glycine soja]|uniref:Protein STRUBBELIG-RECEPTOR FAMILY 3 n=1 Tax=Glycine soja TaxID=3848 RepID=A0A0B2PTS2_GLYSO|nr:Protein STRUBBELIG-RECEPTOR FAMILY 3 [Glycine soja]